MILNGSDEPELEFSGSSRAELGHFNFRAETELKKKFCAKKAINLEKSPARFQLENWDAPAQLGLEPL